MQTFTANEAKTRFGEFMDRAQREPVGVLKHDRLQHRLDASAQSAARAGMTAQVLDTLLADES